MKIVIIGAGIAGLSLGIFLQKYNIAVSINERASGTLGGGHAFLMHTHGLSILQELGEGSGMPLPGKSVERFILRNADGTEVHDLELGAWQCIKRADLTLYLNSLLREPIKDGREFSHFLYEDKKVQAAVFTNGEVEYGDVFIGADGGFSKVRSQSLGEVEFIPGRVKEVVGIAEQAAVAHEFAGIFSKFQKREKGLAFGMIPTSAKELVWFMQFDPSLAVPEDVTPEALSAFCQQQLHDFPEVVQKVLQGNNFERTYVWNTRDFDLLPRFHHQNVAVIGDAAHLALPFTSAGTTNAMVDAKTLADMLL
ncbi:FAD-dependent oxidoreductase, partial [Pedobacter sp.]|uniref:FAD-dependent oxidoreductase n=1 Tax=Pedobacter sp. TaxID=1411316 RepID=UPI003D7F2AA9